MERRFEDEVCGRCRYNRVEHRPKLNQDIAEFYCCNPESELYGNSTFYNDYCTDWEAKDDI